jgi:outer membrane protein assembly factor BamB
MMINAQRARAPEAAAGAHGPSTALAGLVGDGVALLRVDTGAQLWRKWVRGEITSLAHGGDIVYLAASSGRTIGYRTLREVEEPSPIERFESGDPIFERDPSGVFEYHVRTDRVDIAFDLARIEARRASDGALLWSQRTTSLQSQIRLALEGAILAVSGTSALQRESVLFGLDARSGATRWRQMYTAGDDTDASGELAPPDGFDAASAIVPRDLRRVRAQVVTARDGRLYVDVQRVTRSGEVSRWIEALDMATGAELWTREIDSQTQRVAFSWGGALVVDIARTATNTYHLTARDAASGALVGEVDFQGSFQGISDDGVAYIMDEGENGPPQTLRISAARADEAAESKPDALFVTRVIQRGRNYRDSLVETLALDVETGATGWTWRSPENLAALLRLWGPGAFAAFAASIGRELARNGLTLVRGLRNELEAGQWRHPAALESLRLDATGDTVYLGGRLGVFALSAHDGRLLWSGLRNVEVNTRLPLLISPPRDG